VQNEAEFESALAGVKQDPQPEANAREVIAKYGPMLTPEGIDGLDPEMFKAFLRFDENRHWTAIHRYGGRLTSNLPSLKEALRILVEEGKPISERIDNARQTVGRGIGKALVSAILLVAHPSKYGVYNQLSEAGLKRIGMFPGDSVPDFDDLSVGRRYELVNAVLTELSRKYEVSLWSLDTVLGELGSGEETEALPAVREAAPPSADPDVGIVPAGRFALERQLENFLVENWGETDLSKSLEILTDADGDICGQQYHTDVGPIDLLCRNKDGTGYTVVELKRDQTSDGTIGQVARYMGWVKKNLVNDGQTVRGLIIGRDADERLMSALEVVPNVEVFTYAVSFSLSKKESS
jgi:Endonuclease NucS